MCEGSSSQASTAANDHLSALREVLELGWPLVGAEEELAALEWVLNLVAHYENALTRIAGRGVRLPETARDVARKALEESHGV